MSEVTVLGSNEKLEEFFNLRAKGVSFNDITKELGGSKTTWIKRSVKYQGEINNRKILVKQMLMEKHELTLIHQIDAIKTELDSIEDVLENSDYSEIKPEKLIDMKFKLLDRANKLLDDGEVLRSEETLKIERDKQGLSFHERIKHGINYPSGCTETGPSCTGLGENDE